MHVTTDMWLAPSVPGYEEVRQFQERMGKKLGSAMGGAMSPMMGSRGHLGGHVESFPGGREAEGVPVLKSSAWAARWIPRPPPRCAKHRRSKAAGASAAGDPVGQ